MDWNEIAGLINGEHCAALMLVLVLCCILSGRKALSERVHQGSFWITIIACTLLAAQNILENYAQLDPARRQMRLITSIAGIPSGRWRFSASCWWSGRRICGAGSCGFRLS